MYYTTNRHALPVLHCLHLISRLSCKSVRCPGSWLCLCRESVPNWIQPFLWFLICFSAVGQSSSASGFTSERLWKASGTGSLLLHVAHRTFVVWIPGHPRSAPVMEEREPEGFMEGRLKDSPELDASWAWIWRLRHSEFPPPAPRLQVEVTDMASDRLERVRESLDWLWILLRLPSFVLLLAPSSPTLCERTRGLSNAATVPRRSACAASSVRSETVRDGNSTTHARPNRPSVRARSPIHLHSAGEVRAPSGSIVGSAKGCHERVSHRKFWMVRGSSCWKASVLPTQISTRCWEAWASTICPINRQWGRSLSATLWSRTRRSRVAFCFTNSSTGSSIRNSASRVSLNLRARIPEWRQLRGDPAGSECIPARRSLESDPRTFSVEDEVARWAAEGRLWWTMHFQLTF